MSSRLFTLLFIFWEIVAPDVVIAELPPPPTVVFVPGIENAEFLLHQQRISLVQRLHPNMGFFTGVDVRMPLLGKFPVFLPGILGRRVPGDAQQFPRPVDLIIAILDSTRPGHPFNTLMDLSGSFESGRFYCLTLDPIPFLQRSFQTGALFSRNAATPSFPSSVKKLFTMTFVVWS